MILFAAALLLPWCAGAAAPEKGAVRVIFETDMGNDIDDALALDMLYKYADEGRITLLGITSNKEEHPASVEYIDILNTFYGYPDIPVGRIREGANCDRENSFVAQTSRDGGYDLRLRCAARKCGAAATAACVAGRR